MDMDSAISVMKWCIFAFAVTMFSLGHVMSGNGNDGLQAMDAQAVCDNNSKVIGVDIDGGAKHHLCRR